LSVARALFPPQPPVGDAGRVAEKWLAVSRQLRRRAAQPELCVPQAREPVAGARQGRHSVEPRVFEPRALGRSTVPQGFVSGGGGQSPHAIGHKRPCEARHFAMRGRNESLREVVRTVAAVAETRESGDGAVSGSEESVGRDYV
jgi:hypothetical protein